MPSASDRIDFGPPRDRGSIRAFVLALIAHLLLILALTWGVNWKSSDDASGALSAEIWTGTPDAAPRQVEAPPTPPAPPEPPPRQAQPAPEKVEPKVDIALEQEKKRKLLEQQRALEIKKLEKLKAELKAKEDQAKRLAAAEEAKKADAKKADAKAADKSKLAEAEAKKQREENLKRLAGMAGGSPNADNKSQVGGGGSSRTYGAILRAAIKPNILFTEDFEGNPMAKVEVRLQSDGTVISQKLIQSSGNKGWDAAALSAIERTRVMPRDVDGKLPDTILIIEMRPRG